MPIRETASVDEVIALLNDAVRLDRNAIEALVESRVECNMALGKHETIQCLCKPDATKCKVGLLGVLNGIFGISETGWGIVTAVYALEPEAKSDEEANMMLAKGEKERLQKFQCTEDKWLHGIGNEDKGVEK